MSPFKKRHPLAVLGLSFITLGIYTIYWLVVTRREMRAANYEAAKNLPPVWWLFIPIIACLVVAVPVMLFHDHTVVVTLLVLLAILIIMASLALSAWWFYQYCVAAARITQATSATILYVLWFVIVVFCGLTPIWMMIVQNDINQLIEKTSA